MMHFQKQSLTQSIVQAGNGVVIDKEWHLFGGNSALKTSQVFNGTSWVVGAINLYGSSDEHIGSCVVVVSA